MRVAYTIRPDGNHTVEVLDRQGENCNNILTQATGLGTVLQDEITGPDCDTVHETTGSGDDSTL